MNTRLYFFLLFLFSPTFVSAQTTNIEVDPSIEKNLQEYSDWLAVTNLDKFILVNELTNENAKYNLYLIANDSFPNDFSFMSNWNELEKAFNEKNPESLEDKLLKSASFYLNIPLDSTTLTIQARDSSLFQIKIFVNDGMIDSNRTFINAQSGDPILVNLDSIRINYPEKMVSCTSQRDLLRILKDSILKEYNIDYDLPLWGRDKSIIDTFPARTSYTFKITCLYDFILKREEKFERLNISLFTTPTATPKTYKINVKIEGAYYTGTRCQSQQKFYHFRIDNQLLEEEEERLLTYFEKILKTN